jgi:hypothetical protein
MENDANTFRRYGAECRRMAGRASEKDKAILMEIAAAWTACAEEEEEYLELNPESTSTTLP